MTPEEEGTEEEGEQPKRRRLDDVPLGLRKPSAPSFDSSRFVDAQRRKDELEERQVQEKVDGEDLEPPEVHQDYEIQDGDEFDRHLEGISSINALKELIAQAREEVAEEMEVTLRPFTPQRMDQLMVFTREAIMGYGEGPGYEELKKRVRELVESDDRHAEDEMERRKQAYLRNAEK